MPDPQKSETGEGCRTVGTMGPDEVAAELYVLAPGEFVERRDAMARELREAGDRTLAADVKKWRRPLVTAWVVNLLAWYRPDELDTLLALGDELLAAQRDRDATAIRNLTDRRQRLVRSLVKQGLELAEEAGQPVGPAAGYEVESTLNAALADPVIAERVRSGRLERPESYAGFGPLAGPSLHIVPEPGAAPARRAGGAQAPATRTSTTRASATGAPATGRTPAQAVPPSARPGKAAQGGGRRAGEGGRGKPRPMVARAGRRPGRGRGSGWRSCRPRLSRRRRSGGRRSGGPPSGRVPSRRRSGHRRRWPPPRSGTTLPGAQSTTPRTRAASWRNVLRNSAPSWAPSIAGSPRPTWTCAGSHARPNAPRQRSTRRATAPTPLSATPPATAERGV